MAKPLKISICTFKTISVKPNEHFWWIDKDLRGKDHLGGPKKIGQK